MSAVAVRVENDGGEAAFLRRQETALILINLAVLAGVAVVHVLFAPVMGTPPRWFFVALVARFAMQTGELMWLTGVRPGPGVVRIYANASIWVNLLFAFLLSRLGGMEDSHYVVLMVIPVVAAAFRYRPVGVAVVLGAAGGLTFLEIWLYFLGRGTRSALEYFEAANVVLVYLVAAAVVALLARQLRAGQAAVKQGMVELERARDRLVEEEKLGAVGRLASSIAHEIRNPVGMIASSLALFREDGMSRDEACAIVTTEAARLERLTDDFLAYARQRPPEREQTVLATALGYVEGLARGRLAEAGVSLTVSCPEDLSAELDPFQIHQALLNLVLNATEASRPGASLRLVAEREGTTLVLAVENPGEAVQPSVAARIFEPFYTTRAAGTGLGLAIVRSIAAAHGGTAELEVNEPGRVRFAIRLPGALMPEEAGCPGS